MRAKFSRPDLMPIESGGGNLAPTPSPELTDLTIYVIDVAAGDKNPSKGGPGIIRSDLLISNRTDLPLHGGASPEVMERDAERMCCNHPFRARQSARRSADRHDRAFHRTDSWGLAGCLRHLTPTARFDVVSVVFWERIVSFFS